MFVYVFADAYQQTSKESRAFLLSEDAAKLDTRVTTVFLVSALCLSIFAYFGQLHFAISSLWNIGLVKLSQDLANSYAGHSNPMLFSLLFWVWICLLSYFLIPLLAIKVVLKENLADYGLKAHAMLKDWKLYLLLYSVMLTILIPLSFTKSFQQVYPIYKPLSGASLAPDFILWEVHYLMQFVAVEFFFRGFMLHGLKRRFGFYAVFMMMIPYCMIHFGKPLAETLAAILAAIVLGALSLKSKSIWLGVAIHVAVAITMDVASLWQQGYLF